MKAPERDGVVQRRWVRTLLSWSRGRWRVALLFEPRDLWWGLHWRMARGVWHEYLHVYLCVLPCLPLFVVIPLRPLPADAAQGRHT